MQTHIVAKTLIFNDEGQVLLVVRGAHELYRPGGYDLPGGRVEDEAGEASLEGAIREAREETGLLLNPAAMQLVFATTKAGYNNDAQRPINIVWLGYVTHLPGKLEVHLSSEHQSFTWLNIDKALEICDGATAHALLEHVKTHNLAGTA